MTAPPPMPNRPARIPVMTPPITTASASQRISLNGTPSTIALSVLALSGGAIGLQRHIRNKRQRGGEKVGASLRRRGGAGERAAERACPRHGAEQAVQMPRNGMRARALRKLALDIGDQRRRGVLRRGKARGLAEHQRIDRDQPPRLLIGGA